MSFGFHKFRFVRKITDFLKFVLCRRQNKGIDKLALFTSFMSSKATPGVKKKKNRSSKPKKNRRNRKRLEFDDTEQKNETPKREVAPIMGNRSRRRKKKNKGEVSFETHKDKQKVELYTVTEEKNYTLNDRYKETEEKPVSSKRSKRKKQLLKDYQKARQELNNQKQDVDSMLVIVEEDSFFQLSSAMDRNSLERFKIPNQKYNYDLEED